MHCLFITSCACDRLTMFQVIWNRKAVFFVYALFSQHSELLGFAVPNGFLVEQPFRNKIKLFARKFHV